MAGEGFENQEEATDAFRANSLSWLLPKGTWVPAAFSPDEEHGVYSGNINFKYAVKPSRVLIATERWYKYKNIPLYEKALCMKNMGYPNTCSYSVLKSWGFEIELNKL